MIKGTLNKSEYLSAIKTAFLKNNKTIVFYNITIISVMAIILWYCLNPVTSILFLGIYSISRILVYMKIRCSFKKRKDLRLETEFSWDQIGLKTRSMIGNTFIMWSGFKKWDENKKVFILYFQGPHYLIIPKSFFPHIELLKSFRHILQNKFQDH